MVSTADVEQVFQHTYYDSLDNQDIEQVFSVVDEDVRFTHTSVWNHGEEPMSHEETHELTRKREIEEFLWSQILHPERDDIRHEVQTIVTNYCGGAPSTTVQEGYKRLAWQLHIISFTVRTRE